jgi:hypothetical protein
MRQKYVIQKNPATRSLSLQEYAELDKGILSFLCQETYDLGAIEVAATSGRNALVSALRTDNMYPPRIYAEQIADALVSLLASPEIETREILFDDSRYISAEPVETASAEALEEKSGDIDELLDSDIDEDFEDKGLVDGFKSSIKIAEDESLDGDNDS